MSIEDSIYNALQSQPTYKELNPYKQQILEEDEAIYEPVTNAIERVLSNSNSAPMAMLLACRLAKDGMDQHNLSYSLHFNESNAFRLIAKICEFKMEEQNDDRGNQYFGPNSDKRNQQIGNSLLRMALDSIQTWAKWVPLDLEENPSNFYITYATLLQKKVKFPKLTYYKEADVENFIDKAYKDPDLTKNYAKPEAQQAAQTQQEGQTQQPPPQKTPTPGENASQSTVIKQVNLTLIQCQQHKRRIAQISASISGSNYPLDELAQPMEWVQTFLSSVEEQIDAVLMEESENAEVDETLAMKLVEEQEYFQGMT